MLLKLHFFYQSGGLTVRHGPEAAIMSGGSRGGAGPPPYFE